MLRNRAAIGLARALERFLYRRAAAVFVASEGFRVNLLAKGVPDAKLAVVPNWTDTRAIGAGALPGEFRPKHGIAKDDFLILHTGNLGAKQKLDNVLDAAAMLREDASTVFCLVGGGAEKQRLQEIAVRRGLANVRFLPLEPKELLPDMLAAADVLLVNQSAQIVDMVVPSKLVTYMAAGRAVVAAVDAASEAACAIGRARCGLVVPPENPAALAAAIISLKANRGVAAQLGRDGRRFAELHFDRALLLARFEDQLVSVVHGGAGAELECTPAAAVVHQIRR